MIVVTYRKRKGGKVYMETFDDKTPDRILSTTTRKPPIPHKYDILDIGVGESFVDTYKKKYKI